MSQTKILYICMIILLCGCVDKPKMSMVICQGNTTLIYQHLESDRTSTDLIECSDTKLPETGIPAYNIFIRSTQQLPNNMAETMMKGYYEEFHIINATCDAYTCKAKYITNESNILKVQYGP